MKVKVPKSKTIWGMSAVGMGLILLNEFVYEIKPSTATIVMLVGTFIFRKITTGPMKWWKK